MIELIAGLAKMMPLDQLVNDVKEACEEWQANPTEENKNAIGLKTMMLTINLTTEKDDVNETLSMISEQKEQQQFFKKMKGGIIRLNKNTLTDEVKNRNLVSARS